MEVVFKNDLISLGWNDDRFAIYDSDGEYIDYFFDMSAYNTEQQINNEIQLIINELESKTEKELCDYFHNHHCCVKETIDGPLSAEQMKELKEEYGEEFVNRIGSSAVIIRE